MCKVLISTGITNSKNALKFMRVAKSPMSKADKDGIGYLAVDSNGQMFSEKWHNNSDFMASQSVDATFRAIEYMIDENLGDYTSYGTVNKNDIKTFAMHTRFATCGREFNNTHPFINNNIGLIHNGVIRNADQLTNKISTCDSETILNEYIEQGVNFNPDNISYVTDALQGYWALGIIGKDMNNRPYLDVLKDTGATLFVTSIKELGKDNLTFCTTKEILLDALATLKWDKGIKIYKVRANVMTRFDAITGEIIGNFKSTSGISDNVKTHKSWSSRYGYSYDWTDDVVASDSKYQPKLTEAKVDTTLDTPDDSAYATFEDFLLENSDWDTQAVYYDLPFKERMDLESIPFETALEYLQSCAEEFYVKTSSK